ncbi:MAG: GAF domain-containing protein, partial [Candidatus Rokubacteria bacterium]|nr:GAF domain-containing protein [Candidatus Rokubacteria bacterium]
DPRTRNVERIRAEGTVSFAGVPLSIGDRPLGALWIATHERHPYTSEELDLLQSLAGHAAIAIHNARLFGEEQARREQLATLLEINKKIGAAESIDTLLTTIAEEAARLIGVDNATFRIVEGDEAVLAAVVGTAREAGFQPRIKVGESFTGHVIAEGRALMGTLDEVPRVIAAHQGLDERCGYVAYLGVPLRLGERTLGALGFRSRRRFTPGDRELAEAFAGQAAIALEHARLYQEASRQAQRMAALADVERLLSETLDPAVVAQRITDSVCSLLNAAASALYRVEPESGALVAVTVSQGGATHWMPRLPAGLGLSGLAVTERRSLVSADTLSDPRPSFSAELREWLARTSDHAILAIPLIVREQTFGALAVRDTTGRVFTGEEIRLAQMFAAQAALALENARLHEETERRRREAEELARLARILTESLDVASVGERIVESVLAQFGGAASGLWLLQPDGSLRSIIFGGVARAHFKAGSVLPPGIGIAGRAAAERRSVWTADALNDPGVVLSAELRTSVEAAGHHAALAVPLRAKGLVIGVLTLTDRVVRTFSESEIALLQAFADQAALALENARLHEETERRRREAEVVAEVAGTINASLDLDIVLQRVVEGARDVCRSDTARIALREPGSDSCRFRYSVGMLFQPLEGLTVEPGKGSGGLVLVTGRPFRTDNYFEDSRITKDYVVYVRAEAHVVEMVVPIRIGDHIEGLLYVDNRALRPFTDGEEASLVRLADHAAVAIGNARLYQEARDSGERLRALNEVNRLVSSSLQIEEVLRNIAAAVARLFDAPYVSIWELDEARGVIQRSQVHGDHDIRHQLPDTLALGEGGVGWAMLHREPILWVDIERDPRVLRSQVRLRHGLRYLTAFPIALGDRILGAFSVNRAAPAPVTPESLAILRSLAAQAAVAIDHARVYGEAQERLRETTTLLEVSQTLTSTLDFDALLRQFMRQIAAALRADSVAIWTLDESGEWLLPTAGYHIPPERLEPGRGLRLSILRDPLYAEAARTGRPVFTADASADERIPRFVTEAVPHQSQLFAPVLVKDRMIGGFFAMWWTAAREFPPRELALVEAIASQAGVAIENARLFQENRRRVEELAAAQDQLVRTEKLRALGEMASGVAHDFNNLLAAILGRSQLLLKHIDDPKLRQWLQVIERSATDGAQTVRRLQEFARVRRDQPHVPVDLNEIVRDALEITQSRWREESLRRGIAIELRTRLGALPPVAGDPVELREAMTNLILNAVDAMPAGGTLTLATAVVADGVEIAVSDTGVGIPERLRDKIFDPFFTTKGPQGTGLGLSMTYGILSRHGARITVESEEGRGSTFRLVFPPAGALESMEREAAVAPAPTGLRCLVVDDEEAVATVIGDVLETAGHRAVVVTDGAAAIERFRSEPFDVVFTDLAMPGVTGWEVVKAVKTQAPHVPVIVVTGFAAELSAEERRAHGVDDVFAKPVKIDDILDAVARVAQRRNEPDGREAS